MEIIKENLAAFASIAVALIVVYALSLMLKKLYFSILEKGIEPPRTLTHIRRVVTGVGYALNLGLIVLCIALNAGVEVLLVSLLFSLALITTMGGTV